MTALPLDAPDVIVTLCGELPLSTNNAGALSTQLTMKFFTVALPSADRKDIFMAEGLAVGRDNELLR